MGIKGLMKLITDHAPNALKEQEMKALFGRKIAIDASMSLYQFLIAVRTGADDTMLTNELGEVTSHLQGLFNRTIRMVENGIKPVFVFDGKPPKLKGGELEQRRERKEEAKQDLQEAKDNELDQEEINKYTRRLVRVTPEHNADAKKLLRLMGMPIVEAPGEAEAQCAALARTGKVFATATEDMDALTFATPKLLRNLTMAAARKLPIIEVDLSKVLEGLEVSQKEFIDLCILLGCDYTDNIKGIGPFRAYKLIKEHKSIEEALKHIDKEKHKIPEDFLYKEAHQLFVNPDVSNEDIKLDWKDPDEEGVVQFLCNEKGFNVDRVKNALKKLKKARGGGTQQRLENFFGTPAPATPKRKLPGKGKKDAKKAKGADSKKDGKKEKGTSSKSKTEEKKESKSQEKKEPAKSEKKESKPEKKEPGKQDSESTNEDAPKDSNAETESKSEGLQDMEVDRSQDKAEAEGEEKKDMESAPEKSQDDKKEAKEEKEKKGDTKKRKPSAKPKAPAKPKKRKFGM